MEEGLTKAQLERRKLVTYKDMGEPLPKNLPATADMSASVVQRSPEFDFMRGKSKPKQVYTCLQLRTNDAIIIVNNL